VGDGSKLRAHFTRAEGKPTAFVAFSLSNLQLKINFGQCCREWQARCMALSPQLPRDIAHASRINYDSTPFPLDCFQMNSLIISFGFAGIGGKGRQHADSSCAYYLKPWLPAGKQCRIFCNRIHSFHFHSGSSSPLERDAAAAPLILSVGLTLRFDPPSSRSPALALLRNDATDLMLASLSSSLPSLTLAWYR
jgi:hypothetical protein